MRKLFSHIERDSHVERGIEDYWRSLDGLVPICEAFLNCECDLMLGQTAPFSQADDRKDPRHGT